MAPQETVLISNETPTALVTDAAYGLAAATALTLARDGCDVAVSELRIDGLSGSVAKIEAMGRRALPLVLDAGSPASIAGAYARVLGPFGHRDLLVNNAGTARRRYALDMTRDGGLTAC